MYTKTKGLNRQFAYTNSWGFKLSNELDGSLTRRDFLKVVGGTVAGGLSLADLVRTGEFSTSQAHSATVDTSMYDGPYIHNGKLTKETALLIGLNLLSPNKHTRYNRPESDGKVIKLIPYRNWAITFPPFQSEIASYLIPDLPKFLHLIGCTSSDDLIWPRDFHNEASKFFTGKDSKRIEDVVNHINRETRIPLQPGETYDQRIAKLTELSEYFQLHERESKRGNILAEGILEQEKRIMLEAGSWRTGHQTDAEQMNKWYALNSWKDFKIVSIGAQIVPEFKIGVPVNQSLSNENLKIEYDLYVPSQRDQNRRTSEIYVPIEDFRKIAEGTKYGINDYRGVSEQLQADINSGKLNLDLLKFMNRLYVNRINSDLSSLSLQTSGSDFAESRLHAWRRRAFATPLTSDAGIKNAVVTYHEPYKT